MEIEDTDLDIKHYIEYIVPFPNEKVQFLNEGLSFVPLINWGDLVDGIDTRDGEYGVDKYLILLMVRTYLQLIGKKLLLIKF